MVFKPGTLVQLMITCSSATIFAIRYFAEIYIAQKRCTGTSYGYIIQVHCNVGFRPTTKVYSDLQSGDLNFFDLPELFTSLLTYFLHTGHI